MEHRLIINWEKKSWLIHLKFIFGCTAEKSDPTHLCSPALWGLVGGHLSAAHLGPLLIKWGPFHGYPHPSMIWGRPNFRLNSYPPLNWILWKFMVKRPLKFKVGRFKAKMIRESWFYFLTSPSTYTIDKQASKWASWVGPHKSNSWEKISSVERSCKIRKILKKAEGT